MNIETTNTPLVLTTGIYDLLKDQLRRRKLSKANAERLEFELKNAKQVLNRDLPLEVVTTDTIVRVKDLETGEEIEQKFVAPQKARRKNGTTSILSEIGVATLGYAPNAIVTWELADGVKSYQILTVDRLTKSN